MRRISWLAAGLGLALSSTAVHAQDASGSWRCKATDNIPMATINIDGAGNYAVIVALNSVWDQNVGDPGNGTGTLAFSGNQLIPQSGPLLTEYEVTGVIADHGSGPTIGWAWGDSQISLMHCWPADQIG